MSNEIEECSICKQPLISNVVTLSCGHTYHRECILMWSNRKLDCPLCRRNFTNRNKNVLGIRTRQPTLTRIQPTLTERQVNNIIGNFRPISPETMGFVPMSRPTIPSEFNLTSNYQPPINIRAQESLNGIYTPTPPRQSPQQINIPRRPPQPINIPRRTPQQTETPYRRLFTIQPTSNLTTSTEQSNIRRSRRRNRSTRGNRNVNRNTRNTRNTTRRRLGGSNRKKYRKKNNKSKKLK